MNRHIKSIVHAGRAASFVYNPHEAVIAKGAVARDEDGGGVRGPFNDAFVPRDPATLQLRLNHYREKSVEELVHKWSRGNADGKTAADPSANVGHSHERLVDEVTDVVLSGGAAPPPTVEDDAAAPMAALVRRVLAGG